MTATISSSFVKSNPGRRLLDKLDEDDIHRYAQWHVALALVEAAATLAATIKAKGIPDLDATGELSLKAASIFKDFLAENDIQAPCEDPFNLPFKN